MAPSAQETDFEVAETLPWSTQRVLLVCGQAEEGITKNLIFNQMFDFSQTGFSLHYLLSCHIVGLIFICLFISKHVTCPWVFLGYISCDLNYVHLKPPRTWPIMQIHTVLIIAAAAATARVRWLSFCYWRGTVVLACQCSCYNPHLEEVITWAV